MQWFIFFIIFIFGTVFGCFLNAWMWRARIGISVSRGRSVCQKCESKIAWHDIIPILSFFVLKGKCRKCSEKISWQYPLVELWMGLLFLFVFWFHARTGLLDLGLLFRDYFILFFLTFIFVYDLKYQHILDQTTVVPALVLFIASVFFGWQAWELIAIGAAAGTGFFLLQYIISKGRWIGGGDIGLGFFMGVILGWPFIILGLITAYVLGAIVNLPLLIMKKKKLASRVPFGTYLSLASFVVMFWGEGIMEWYLGLIF